MRKMILFTMVVALLASCANQINGEGEVTEIEHNVDKYDAVEISGMFEVEWRKGASKVMVVTNENLHEHIDIKVESGELEIGTGDKFLKGDEMRLILYSRDLSDLELSGAIEFRTYDPIKGQRFDLDISGAGDADLDLDVKTLEIEISGGCDLHLKGESETADIEISGAGDIDASKLQVKSASIEITGAGDITIDATDELDVKITGAGEVRYLGSPQVSKSITGAGEISRLEH